MREVSVHFNECYCTYTQRTLPGDTRRAAAESKLEHNHINQTECLWLKRLTLYWTLVRGANLLPLVELHWNEWWSCNCSAYYLLSLVSPTLCPRSVIFRVLRLEGGDYPSHPLIWRHKNIPQLYPWALGTHFTALMLESQALACSADHSVMVQDSC